MSGYEGLAEHQILTSHKQLLFTRVVALAEKEGKSVHLLVVPSSNPFDAIAQTAMQLDSAVIIDGRSPGMPPDRQVERFRKAWEKFADKPKHSVFLRIVESGGKISQHNLLASARSY